MKIYLVGICGTFMAGLALLAREKGFTVVGSDQAVYPPMSTQLEQQGIELFEGYTEENLQDADLYIIGNAISRGNPQVEAILDRGLPYTSGAQWLHDNILHERWVLAVAGTHGKSTTSSMLAWILHDCGLNPGYLIGGMNRNFERSAALGDAPFFVIEADEYDTAFFDKRSKFVHYHPRTLVLNNLEFDHADIFDDLAAIKRQFHHLLRIVPGSGQLIINADDWNLAETLDMGCWSEQVGFGVGAGDFRLAPDGVIAGPDGEVGRLEVQQVGEFNQRNALAAVLAARHAGVPIANSLDALTRFKGVKRRQEILATIDGVEVIDDFAHHPTAIAATLESLKSGLSGRLFACLEIRSNTMKRGDHQAKLGAALVAADGVFIPQSPDISWNLHALEQTTTTLVTVCRDNAEILARLVPQLESGDRVVIMSNGGFGNLQQRLIEALQANSGHSKQDEQTEFKTSEQRPGEGRSS